ncbi:MAG: GNAT family N-acetyltransferase [Balneolaceae bacterium]|jgi:phosphinothricin acetyltransferase
MITFAKKHHLQAINDIYNQAVEDGFRTAHTCPISMSERKSWFYHHTEKRYPVFVFIEDERVVGWLSISSYRSDRQALDEVVEVSYYVDYHHHGKGIATRLMQHAIDFCDDAGYRIMVAILVSDNKPSFSFLKKFDFREGGRIPNAIHYHNEFRDHLYMFKNLSSKTSDNKP